MEFHCSMHGDDVNRFHFKKFDYCSQCLWLTSSEVEITTIELRRVIWCLYEKSWEGRSVPMHVIDGIEEDKYFHLQRVCECELEYPICIYRENTGEDTERVWVLDGIHRVAKSHMAQNSHILAREITDDILFLTQEMMKID